MSRDHSASSVFVERWTVPATVGVLSALLPVACWQSLDPKWAAYIILGIAAAAVLPLCVMITGDAARLFLILLVFSLQFRLGFNLVYEIKPLPGGMQGINISVTLIAVAASVGIWAVGRAFGNGTLWRTHRPFLITCLVFVAVSALSFANTTTRMYSIYGLVANASLTAIALTVCHLASTRQGVKTTWAVLLAVLVTQSVVLLGQRALGVSFSMSGEILENRYGDRYGGTMGIAPVNASTLLMILLFFAEQRLITGTRRIRQLTALAFGAGLLCLLLSQTRSCWIGFIGGSACLTVIAVRRGELSISSLLRLSVVGLFALMIAWGTVHDRLGANHEGAAEERWRLNYIGLEMIKAHPVVGIGLNTAYDTLKTYVPSFIGRHEWIFLPHNQFILVTAETGLIGLVTFVALLIVGLQAALRCARAADPLIRDTGTVLAVSLGSMLWGMNLDFYSGMQVYVLLWFVLGFSAGVFVLHRNEMNSVAGGAALAGGTAGGPGPRNRSQRAGDR